jgi:hypothetical protein
MENQTFVFVYAKGFKIKVLNIEESKRLDTDLKSDGWKHTATLDACTFIQFLHNDCDNIRKKVKSLSKVAVS